MQSLRNQFLSYRVNKSKKPDAFIGLYRDYYGKILRFVHYKVPTKEIAEDITEDVFERTLEYLLERKIDNFNAFIYQVARNQIAQHYRQNNTTLVDIDVVDQAKLPGIDKVREEVDKNIDSDRLAVAIKKLKGDFQEVIIMRYLDDLTVNEVAEIVNKTPGHIRVITHRAIKSLQSIIKENE